MMASKRGVRKIIPASELVLSDAIKEKVRLAMLPLEAWENIDAPTNYLEARSGKYVKGLEALLDIAVEMNDFEAIRELTLDLLKMTSLGKAKLDLNVGSVSKLREEVDLSKVSIDQLREVVGKKDGR